MSACSCTTVSLFLSLASAGASIEVMRRDAELMRGSGPVLFTKVKFGDGVPEVVEHILRAQRAATDAGWRL